MDTIYYCTKKEFATIWRSFDVMNKLTDRDDIRSSPCMGACMHIWNKPAKEKFVYIFYRSWTNRCVDCFNAHTRNNFPKETVEKLGIPIPAPGAILRIQGA